VERSSEFEEQCLMTNDPLCSTEDMTLRGSTPFNLSTAAVQHVPPPMHFKPTIWSIICFSACIGASLILFVHALARRAYIKHCKKRDAFEKQAQTEHQSKEDSDNGSTSIKTMPRDDLMDVSTLVNTLNKRDGFNQKAFEEALYQWNAREWEKDQGDDDTESMWDEKDEKDYEEEDGEKSLEYDVNRNSLLGNTLVSLMSSNSLKMDLATSSSIDSNRPALKVWKRRASPTQSTPLEGESTPLAIPEDGKELLPQVKPKLSITFRHALTWLGEKIFIDEATLGTTSTGANKVAYLSSLRGFAALLVTLGHVSVIRLVFLSINH